MVGLHGGVSVVKLELRVRLSLRFQVRQVLRVGDGDERPIGSFPLVRLDGEVSQCDADGLQAISFHGN